MHTKKTLDTEQFDRLFAALGYCLKGELPGVNGPDRVYVNPDYDAIQIMPPAGQERLDHLVNLRIVSIGKGITDEEGFDRLLERITQS
jgi:hypothetical protein